MKDDNKARGQLDHELSELSLQDAALKRSESEDKYRSLVENIRDVIYELDHQGVILYISPAIRDLLGYDSAEIVGKDFIELSHEDDKNSLAEWFSELRKGREHPSEYRVINKSGDIRWARTKTRPILEDGRFKGAQGILIDVTDQRLAEEKLRNSEARFKAQYQGNPVPTFTWQKKEETFELVDYNRAAKDATKGEVINYLGKTADEMYQGRPEILQDIHRCFTEKEIIKKELQSHHFMFGRTLITTYAFIPPDLIMVHAEDITERKRAEEMLRMSKDYLDNIINATGYPIFVKDESFRFTLVNNALCGMLGIERENIIGKTLVESLPEDQMEHFLKVDKMVLDSGLENQCEELLTGSGGKILNIVTKKTRFVDKQGNKFLVGVIYDITERKQADNEIKVSFEKLRKAMGGIIQAMALTVEVRDPYTAGHQRRVADLARAIAQEMGLPEDQVDGLRMAGIVHDLGKIGVPAEILSKPAKLTNLEFSLIKIHPQVSYDILKDIDFPWPVAEIVLKHHERLNGSGYPKGLKRDEICREAQILMVADVVEAMASHRPYRPALGIDKALEEISQNKGILYDPEAVEVCLRLFREKGYKFE